ncbi:MAG: sulfotransferase [Cyanobacteria bacterium J06576_12]
MNTSGKKEQQYLIIGGTTKAATTSLYYYLADHPDICPATRKETRFFIDEDYPVPSSSTIGWATTPEQFDATYFKSATEQYRLEATPDYLYSMGTPQRLKDMLPDVKVVFLLRDPVTRMISWYKYARQRVNIPETMSFDEYVEKQLSHEYFEETKQDRLAIKAKEDAEAVNSGQEFGFERVPPSYFFCALEHGRYTKYIKQYIDILGPECVKVYCYEDLCADPQAVLFNLCEFASLPPDFYANYDFKVFNRSRKMKNARLNRAYSSLRSAVRRRTHNHPIHKVLKQLRLWTDPLYYRLNSQKMQEIQVSPYLQSKLEKYYKDDVALLENLMGRALPWSVSTSTKNEQKAQNGSEADVKTADLETTLAKP